MKKKTERPEEKKKAPTERERKQAVARIRAKREKIFDDSPEKPAFQERKEQFENPSFCHAEVGGEKAYRFLLDIHL